MSLPGKLIAHLDQAQLIEITIEGLDFRIYVAQRDANVEHVATLVPASEFKKFNNVHVAAIDAEHDITAEVSDVLFNLNPGDCIVFLCTSFAAYTETLAEFEQQPLPIHRT